MEKCALFDIETKIVDSHLYPKFAVKFLKDTGSKYLRNPIAPNRRMQDGVKFPLLGEKAELAFSKREKWFSEKIFRPYHFENKKCFNYNQNLHYFAVSFLWRALAFQLNKADAAAKPFTPFAIQCFNVWREFLISPESKSAGSDIYFALTSELRSHNIDSENVDGYFTRVLDSTIGFSDDYSRIFIYGKFTRFVFWSMLRGKKEENECEHRINPTGGYLNAHKLMIGPEVLNFMVGRILGFDQFPLASEDQGEIIAKEMVKSFQRDPNSDLFRSLYRDMNFPEDL